MAEKGTGGHGEREAIAIRLRHLADYVERGVCPVDYVSDVKLTSSGKRRIVIQYAEPVLARV